MISQSRCVLLTIILSIITSYFFSILVIDWKENIRYHQNGLQQPIISAFAFSVLRKYTIKVYTVYRIQYRKLVIQAKFARRRMSSPRSHFVLLILRTSFATHFLIAQSLQAFCTGAVWCSPVAALTIGLNTNCENSVLVSLSENSEEFNEKRCPRTGYFGASSILLLVQ